MLINYFLSVKIKMNYKRLLYILLSIFIFSTLLVLSLFFIFGKIKVTKDENKNKKITPYIGWSIFIFICVFPWIIIFKNFKRKKNKAGKYVYAPYRRPYYLMY